MELSASKSAGPGRPPEIEELANRLWVHPTSRALVDRLIHTPIRPNHVSVSSVVAAAATGAVFIILPPPWEAIAGLAGLFLWHVLDGADGDLARRTGRESAAGELIDGVCDHTSQALIYVSLAIVLERSIGLAAWPIALGAAVSHAIQANAYEAGRKTYRHWVYGAAWMRQRPDNSRSLAGVANRAYLKAAALFSPNEDAVDTAMSKILARGSLIASEGRVLYQTIEGPLVKRSGILGSTGRSLAIFLSLIAGNALWFFMYEILFLNVATIVFVGWRGRANRRVAAALGGFGAEL